MLGEGESEMVRVRVRAWLLLKWGGMCGRMSDVGG